VKEKFRKRFSWVLKKIYCSAYKCNCSIGLSVGLIIGLSNGVIVGVSAGLLTGLQRGGLACLRHYVLRLLLWRTGSVPWLYAQFLDYAAEHILLRKVGGGYIFLHRLLLDYFAARETTLVLQF